MTIHHHPSDENILAYANGSLKRTLSMAIGAHLESCSACRDSLAFAEDMAGTLLDYAPMADLQEGALASLLDRLEKPSAQPVFRAARPFREQLRYIGKKYWLAPGIWVHPILKLGQERAYFLGAAPGKTLPSHGHKGMEMTQVLEGEFFDGGTRYGPGDFLEADEEIEHTLQVGPKGPCICLVASESVPRGLPGLLMQLIA